MSGKKILGLFAIIAILVGGFLAATNSTFIKKNIFAQAMPLDYFAPYKDKIPPALYQVEGPVWAYEHGFTRSLVIASDEGLAVFDTFDETHASAMKAALAKAFPNKQVRWVVFSHNHLDHVRGSDVFAGAEVIGHKHLNFLVRDFPKANKGVADVTRPISGDQTLQLGNVAVDALFMPFSHSHTLYGFHVRGADVVFAADMMFVKLVPPFDFPDFYHPGYIRALDRLIALDAAHYVPSHADRGTKQDLIDFRNMMVTVETTIREALLERGVENGIDGNLMREGLKESYDVLYAQYGDWHGFDAMFVPKFGRHWGGTYLGY